MQRIVLAALVAGSLIASTGCMIPLVGAKRSSKSSALRASSDDCPPGHRWSDGRCHSTGKGHDPAKHKNKKKKRA